MLALVPAFLLAHHRGWRGVAFALAAGMVALTLTHLVLSLSDRTVENPVLLFAAVTAWITGALGVGAVSELLHRELARA